MVQQEHTPLDAAFLALADSTRRGVLERLGRSEASITELADQFQMTLTGMKKHVSVLEGVGLVTTEKVGRVRTCRIGTTRLEHVAGWIEQYQQRWEARFRALDDVVEDLQRREKRMNARTRDESAVGRNPVTVERASDREIVVTRTFDAPAELVFEAWTRPELFRQWWLPRSMGMTLQSLEMDARTGGGYHLDFGDGVDFYGTYLEVTPCSRIVWTNDEGENGSVTTISFEARGEQTLLVMSEVYASAEALEAGAGAEDATHETFGQLDDLLAQRQV